MDGETLRTLGTAFLIVAGASLLLAALFLGLTYYQVKRLRLPPGLGFVGTLRQVPFGLVLGLDLLDLALDIFSAPVSWIILTKLNLQGLRGVTAVESLLPFTQAIPTLTAAWIAVRLLNLGADDPRVQWIEGQAREVRQLPPRDSTRYH